MERRSKYNARPVEIDGIRFDSTAESRRYMELKLLEYSREIWGLRVHPRFEIIPSLNYNGRKLRPVFYEADFEYYEDNGEVPPTHVVEDVKGMETAVFRVKSRMFLQNYPDTKFVITKVEK